MRRTAWTAIGAVAIVSGCTSVPADYAASLSKQDPKWSSPRCVEARSAALKYKERNLYWASGLLIGPYGLAIVAAGKEHQEKQRVMLARDIHLQCSSQPLPNKLKVRSAAREKF
jgi:hypothetical protein